MNSTIVVQHTNVTGNRAEFVGGFMHATESTLALERIRAIDNSASSGGIMSLWNSSATIEHVEVALNHVSFAGGFMTVEDSTVTLSRMNATGNRAEYGGILHVWRSTVTAAYVNVTGGRADSGGFLDAELDSTVVLRHVNVTNSRAREGGFVFARNSTLTMENINAMGNRAIFGGGCMSFEASSVRISHINAADHVTDPRGRSRYMDHSRGGFMYLEDSTVTVERMISTNHSTELGGFAYARNSKLEIRQSYISMNNSTISGGFAASENSSIFLSDCTIAGGRAKIGGAILLETSQLAGQNLSIVDCEADGGGGGVMGRRSSSFLCADCQFRNNLAKGGNGGAVFLDAKYARKQTLVLQLVRSSRREWSGNALQKPSYSQCLEAEKYAGESINRTQ